MGIKNHIMAELYKVSHSSLIWIHIFAPLFAMGVFLVYYRFAAWSELGKVAGYLQILSIAYPIALVTTVLSDLEMRAGHCQQVLTVPCRRGVIHVVKLSVLLVCGLLSSLLAVLGFGAVFRAMGNSGFSLSFFAGSAILLFCGNIALYEISYLVSFQFSASKGAGIGVGIVGSLVAALMQTGLGNQVWYYVPWGISLRWCSLYALDQAGNTDRLLCTDVIKSVIFVIVSGSVLFILLICWGNTWEAKAAGEE